MKKFFISILAIAVLAGCAKEQKPGLDYTPTGENSYMAVTLKAPTNLTKVAEGEYEDDLSAESKAKSAIFMFFDAAGNPYAVANGTNCVVEGELKKGGETDPNVEWFSEAILVIEKTQTVDPKWVIAVINPPTDFYANNNAKPMATVKEAVLESYYDNDTDKHIVMSNAVYMTDEGTSVFEVELVEGNLMPSEAEAKTSPVTIYVERVCSKVRVNIPKENIPVMVQAEGDQQMVDSEDTPIYFKVLGWQVTNNIKQTGLAKVIDPAWKDADLGFTWNDIPYFRSYWAVTKAELDPVHEWTWTDVTGHNVASDYYFENTITSTLADNGVDKTGALGNNYSQLLVAGQFVDKEGNVLDIAKWYGKLYTLADLKTAIASTLSLRIYIKTDEVMTSIAPEDLEFVQVADTKGDNRYECYLKVATESEGKAFVDGTGTTLTVAQVNEQLAAIAPAQIWGEGAYYYTPIRHLGTEGSTGEFGMVRNHLYDITIQSVIGLGTPVYDADMIITPEKPEDDKYSYVAAKINVLAWRLVSQNVVLQ